MSPTLAFSIVLVLWGIIPLLDKAGLAGEKVDPIAGLIIRLLAAGLLLIPAILVSPAVRAPLHSVSLRGWLIISASGVFSLVISQYFYYSALQTADVSRLFPALFCGAPVVTILGGWLLFREAISPQQITGCLLLVAGTYLVLK